MTATEPGPQNPLHVPLPGTAPGRPSALAERPSSLLARTTRNAGVSAAAQLIGKLTTFAWTVVAARQLSRADFGSFSLALSVALLVAAVADWSFDLVLMRRGSRQPDQLERYYAQAVGWQAIVGAPAFFAAGVALWLTRPSEQDRIAAVLVLVAVFVDLWSDTARATSAAAQDQRGTAAALVAQRVTTSLLAVPGVVLGGLDGLAGAFLVGSLVGVLAHVAALRRLGVRLRLARLTASGMRAFASGTLALGVSVLVGMALFRLDAVLVAALRGEEALASYATAYRLFDTALFATFAITSAIYPLMSAEADDPTRTTRWVAVGVAASGALYLPYLAVTVVEAPALLRLLFGDLYADTSASALRWLSVAPLLYATGFLAGSALTALHRTRAVLLASCAAFAGNFAADLVLIPRFGGAGAAAASTTAFAVETAVLLMALRRHAGPVRLGRVLAGPASGAAAVIVVLLLSPLPLLPSLAMAAMTYLGVWFSLLRRHNPDQLQVLRQLVPLGRLRCSRRPAGATAAKAAPTDQRRVRR